MKTQAWLLSWNESEEVHKRTVFSNYKTAMAHAEKVIRRVFSEDDPETMERNFIIFRHKRDDGEHWCGGVSLMPVPFIKG
jgi:hypothetical protein